MVKEYNILIVGVGSIGERHVRCFLETSRAAVSICELNETLRQSISDNYEIGHSFASLADALQYQYDAAVIATPANTHIPIALQLAEAGIHLLIEKPLSTSAENIERLTNLVTEKQLTVAVAYVTRAHPALAAMRKAIAENRFGKPVHLVANSGQHFPTYRPAYREIYYNNRATGGGAIQDALTHTMNAAQWLVGEVDQLVADAANQVLDGVEVEDTVNVLTRHQDILGCFSLNQHQSPNENTITVVCENGTARFEYHQHRWRWMSQPDAPWRDEPFNIPHRDSLFLNQANMFLDTLEGLTPPACSLEEGIHSLNINQAIINSARSKCWVSVPSILQRSAS